MKQKEQIYLRDKKQCQYCGIGLSLREATVDHVIPKINGGQLGPLLLCCVRCNREKGANTLEDFRQIVHQQANIVRNGPNARRYKSMTDNSRVLFFFERWKLKSY